VQPARAARLAGARNSPPCPPRPPDRAATAPRCLEESIAADQSRETERLSPLGTDWSRRVPDFGQDLNRLDRLVAQLDP